MMPSVETYAFEAELWEWDAQGGWFFVTLPPDLSEDLRFDAGPPRGFGSVRVEVTVGSTTWRTSVFPSKETGSFVLPMKKAVRRTEGIDTGDQVAVSLTLVDAAP